jgi:hypothetical protein
MARADSTKSRLADDLLDGAAAIAEFTGWSERRVFYLAETKQLPCFKVGSKWCARRSTLREYIEKLESGAAA